jgi:integrase
LASRERSCSRSADLDPATGRARLSYRRAEELFTELTRPLAHPDVTDPARLADAPGWTLHDLRHSALTHAAENGANTGVLLAYSGHASVASLARYTRVSPDALTRWQSRRDPHRRHLHLPLTLTELAERHGSRASRSYLGDPITPGPCTRDQVTG